MTRTMAAKTGVDDYLAAGGTIAELKLMARPFSREDFVGVRLSRDEKLRARVEDLWRQWRYMPTVKQGECTDSRTARELIKRAGSSGRLVEGGVRIRASVRSLALALGLSTRGQLNSLRRLEASGFLRADNEGRVHNQAGAYILLITSSTNDALGKQNGERDTVGESQEGEKGNCFSQESAFFNASSDRGVYVARSPHTDVPELRWSRAIVTWWKDKHDKRHYENDPLVRLGKKRAMIIEHLVEADGEATVAELMQRFAGPKTRPYDFKRRTLAMLEGYRLEGNKWLKTGLRIVTVEGNVVRLVDGWREALENARRVTGEQEAAQLQAEKYARQWASFHHPDRDKHDEVPEPPAVDDDMREPWPHHPEANSPAEDWSSHRLDCECVHCLYPEPNFARPYRESGVRYE